MGGVSVVLLVFRDGSDHVIPMAIEQFQMPLLV